jgi:DNA-binding NtrC family response regulator
MSRLLVLSDSGREIPELFAGILTPDWEFGHWDAWTVGRLKHSGCDLVLLVGLPDPSGAIELLCKLERDAIRSRLVAILPRELEPAALALVSSVADDFVLFPETAEVIWHRIKRFLVQSGEVQRAKENLLAALGRANLVGQDPVFLSAAEKIFQSANNDFPALITGETGTGKDMFARAIHFLSRRRGQPFIPVDCAGIPDHLFENELFGHAHGAYTDAHGDQRGLATLADKGTLFLDEIDSLSLTSQAKLLRFLQDHQFKPLGSERFIHSDVRVIAATNRILEQHVAEKQFRSDLYFRLNVLHLHLPPLCERAQDIPLLAQHFLTMYLPPGVRKTLTPGAIHRLAAYHWPGNIRELINVIQQAIVFSQGTLINRCDLEIPETAATAPRGEFRTERKEVLKNFEQEYVEELLRRNQGNITWAAREAGKERRAFGRLVKKYGSAQPPRSVGQF